METIDRILHYNRDENSFTARLFERLIIGFEQNNDFFKTFISKIITSANKNKIELGNDSMATLPNMNLQYTDGIEFVENLDLYSYCISNNIALDINKETIDKTEYDFIFSAKAEDKNIIVVFEVKCFSDLDRHEIERQNYFLQKYKDSKLYDEFYHIALISFENYTRGIVPKENFTDVKNFSIITWDDIKEFIDDKRFRKDIEFNGLHKTISLNGQGENKRYLLKKEE